MLVFINQDFLANNKSTIASNDKNTVYNISSIIECGINISALIPPLYFNGQMIDYEAREFDIWYASYIIETDSIFKIFFSIIYEIYLGKNVYCVFAYTDRLYSILESLMKVIQQRYGINANMISTEEDTEYLEQCDFSIHGVYNLDIDKNRYCQLYTFEELQDIEKQCINEEMRYYQNEKWYADYM